ncbi:hypothetical protein PSY81_23515, partial [Shigella flexneri]|nr:hypothetical protein [Shigella flexneri]
MAFCRDGISIFSDDYYCTGRGLSPILPCAVIIITENTDPVTAKRHPIFRQHKIIFRLYRNMGWRFAVTGSVFSVMIITAQGVV